MARIFVYQMKVLLTFSASWVSILSLDVENLLCIIIGRSLYGQCFMDSSPFITTWSGRGWRPFPDWLFHYLVPHNEMHRYQPLHPHPWLWSAVGTGMKGCPAENMQWLTAFLAYSITIKWVTAWESSIRITAYTINWWSRGWSNFHLAI